MAARPVPLLRSFAPLTVLVLSTFVTLFAYRIAADSNRSRIESEFYRLFKIYLEPSERP